MIINRKEEREIYDARLKWLRDEDAALQKAHEKGVEQGIEQGIEQGWQKGMQEVSKRQLKRGTSVDSVIEDTGLSRKKVEAIKNSADYS